jgi:hypothetical protein
MMFTGARVPNGRHNPSVNITIRRPNTKNTGSAKTAPPAAKQMIFKAIMVESDLRSSGLSIVI